MAQIVVAKNAWPEIDAPSLAAVLERTLQDFQIVTGMPFPRELLVVRLPNPIVLFDKAADGRTIIGISAGGTYWCQFIFQFAHELCHVHAQYDSPSRNSSFKWLEETFCEMASWAVLKQSAQSWASAPPFENWRSFAAGIRTYRKEWMDKARGLEVGASFRSWIAAELPKLSTDQYLRAANARIGLELWPLFDGCEAAWAAVALLNSWDSSAANDLPTYLAQWQARAKAREARVIAQIQTVLCE